MNTDYDVVIIGGGITGTAILYAFAEFTTIPRIALIEKESGVAQLNSNTRHNSQTLHSGEIEAHFSPEKALAARDGAHLVRQYLARYAPHAGKRVQKMMLAVGERECEALEWRYRRIRAEFPHLTVLKRDEILDVEPNVVFGRDPDEKIFALFYRDGRAVDYHALSESFVHEAAKARPGIDVWMNTAACAVTRDGAHFRIATDQGIFSCTVVIVACGPQSLLFAHSIGYAKDFALLPVAGGFYTTPATLNGKVYTMQYLGIPFAAVHGDPVVHDPTITRWGPTAWAIPLLERGRASTLFDFLRSRLISVRGLAALVTILGRGETMRFALCNAGYHIPVMGKRLFLRAARKIVPLLRYSDLRFAHGEGGIRPQLIDCRARKFVEGQGTIEGDRIRFHVTPASGASSCLATAFDDAQWIAQQCSGAFPFDEKKFHDAFGLNDQAA
ncbi:MAG: FAD-dependent oxidoreductase [Candidatus Niyogibacteria bacterium]|nr:FAD-dependent oxidoreductase [Candidatus Niyogibacteria bacterium]